MIAENEIQTETQTPTTPEADAAALAETAKTEDISAYAEERKEQDTAEETGEPAKRKSRYERLKAARDQYKQEAEELRQRLGADLEPQPPQESQNPYEEEVEAGRREAEFAEQMARRDEQIYLAAQTKMRADELRQQVPDFDETIESVKDIYRLPPVIESLMMRSPFGVQMAYCLAKDAWAENSQNILAHFEQLANDPVAQAREFGKMEQAFVNMQQQAPQQRVTQAPPPMRPVSGGSAGGPRDLHSLARSDAADDYIRARRAQDRG